MKLSEQLHGYDACGDFGRALEGVPELKEERKKLHTLIDPIWQSGKMGRRELYEAISREVGWNYHTAKTRTIEEARAAYRAAAKYA